MPPPLPRLLCSSICILVSSLPAHTTSPPWLHHRYCRTPYHPPGFIIATAAHHITPLASSSLLPHTTSPPPGFIITTAVTPHHPPWHHRHYCRHATSPPLASSSLPPHTSPPLASSSLLLHPPLPPLELYHAYLCVLYTFIHPAGKAMYPCVCVCACARALPIQVQLVLEYCDRGGLREALDDGIFFCREYEPPVF